MMSGDDVFRVVRTSEQGSIGLFSQRYRSHLFVGYTVDRMDVGACVDVLFFKQRQRAYSMLSLVIHDPLEAISSTGDSRLLTSSH